MTRKTSEAHRATPERRLPKVPVAFLALLAALPACSSNASPAGDRTDEAKHDAVETGCGGNMGAGGGPVSETGATYFVATDGSDENPGSMAEPFRTIERGVSVLQGGDTLYIRQGSSRRPPGPSAPPG